MANFKIKGLADKNKRADVFHYLKMLNYSIYCIENFHCTCDEEASYYEKEWAIKLFVQALLPWSSNSV
jgi:hypothetical protein